jgi:hypothetical protein
MKEVIFQDEEIRRKDKKYYLRRKVYKRGGAGLWTIRTQKDGKGQRLAQTKVKDFKNNYEKLQALKRLAHKFGYFEFVITVPFDSVLKME